MVLDSSLIAFIVFIAAICIYLYKDRKKIKLHGIIFMRRTERGKQSIDKSVKKHPKLWKVLGTTGLVAAVCAMIFVSLFIAFTAYNVFTSVKVVDGPKIVLPWSSFDTAPGVFFLPWYIWIIAIALIVIPHELFHGFMCRLHKVKIKSLGWLLLAILPGAFVEQDDKGFKKASLRGKLEIAAAGSFANFIIAGLALIITFIIVLILFIPAGVSVGVIANDNYPAYQANMSGYITYVNGAKITTFDQLVSSLDKLSPGDEVRIATNKGNYTLNAIENPERPGKAFLGITQPIYTVNEPVNKESADAVSFLADLFMWIFILSLGIGLFNLLPIKPLDGGVMFEAFANKISPNHGKTITITVSLIMVALVVASLLGPILL